MVKSEDMMTSRGSLGVPVIQDNSLMVEFLAKSCLIHYYAMIVDRVGSKYFR